jgi:NADPH:quinone reductase-like Zn-dependent oxidoreductase
MKAVVCTRYGPPDVLRLQEVADPVAGANDVVIRIRATVVTPSDCYIRSGIPTARLVSRALHRLAMGFTRPRRAILGAVLAGDIESVGKRVTRLAVGDRVWAFTLMRMGCNAQRLSLRATRRLLTPAPKNLTPDESAAIVFGGLFARYFLGRANIERGRQVLVYGASGAIGTCAVQLAKHLGAHVTAVCGTTNVELARSLGADAVLDYMKEQSPSGRRYDAVLDAVGRKKSSPMKEACRTALTANGRYISVDDRLPFLRRDDLLMLKALAEAGHLKPVIDRRYALEQTADAHRYVEQGHKKGNVVVTVGD